MQCWLHGWPHQLWLGWFGSEGACISCGRRWQKTQQRRFLHKTVLVPTLARVWSLNALFDRIKSTRVMVWKHSGVLILQRIRDHLFTCLLHYLKAVVWKKMYNLNFYVQCDWNSEYNNINIINIMIFTSWQRGWNEAESNLPAIHKRKQANNQPKPNKTLNSLKH